MQTETVSAKIDQLQQFIRLGREAMAMQLELERCGIIAQGRPLADVPAGSHGGDHPNGSEPAPPQEPAATVAQSARAAAAVLQTKQRRKYTRSTGGFEKACNLCHVIKPLTAFEENKLCRDGHTGQCKSCRSEKQRKTRLKGRASENAPATAPILDKIAADTKSLRTDGRFQCEPCHGKFISQKALDDHNTERHQGKS